MPSRVSSPYQQKGFSKFVSERDVGTLSAAAAVAEAQFYRLSPSSPGRALVCPPWLVFILGHRIFLLSFLLSPQ